uniref:hexokinase-2-like n=1 Tax=Oncorhynchus gorbuscha TaxID=8017 RepID=UPI001EAF73CC|nr:hexokinase-2-like [Oncorhynchus gorbuscha]
MSIYQGCCGTSITLHVDRKICAILQGIMLGPQEQWFYHIAACLVLELKDQTLPLGCTFSFEQKDIDKSILIPWTKGFL